MDTGSSAPHVQLAKNALRFDLSLTEAQISLGSEQAKVQLATAALQEYTGLEATKTKAESLSFKTVDLEGALVDEAQTHIVTRKELEDVQNSFGCFVSMFSEQKIASGGMPIAIKDVFAFGDHQPTAGLTAPPKDISIGKTNIVGRLQKAGAQIVGTTKCSPWCYVPTEQNEYVSPPVNPLGEDLLVGGSSSGAAVAVASGVVPVAIGTDTGGSVRIPAALCGLYGYKSTPTSIEKSGGVPLGGLQDTVGILAKDPKDIIKVYDVIAMDQAVHTTHQVIGIPDTIFDLSDPEICTARDIISGKAGLLGWPVQTCPGLDLDRINAVAGIVTGHFAGLFHGKRMAAHPAEYPISIIGRICTGLAFSEEDNRLALCARDYFLNHMLTHVFGSCSFVLAPTVNHFAQKSLAPWNEQDPAVTGALNIELLSMNRWVNLLGLPAVTIPVNIGQDVPSAVQIVGRPGSDSALLELVTQLSN